MFKIHFNHHLDSQHVLTLFTWQAIFCTQNVSKSLHHEHLDFYMNKLSGLNYVKPLFFKTFSF